MNEPKAILPQWFERRDAFVVAWLCVVAWAAIAGLALQSERSPLPYEQLSHGQKLIRVFQSMNDGIDRMGHSFGGESK